MVTWAPSWRAGLCGLGGWFVVLLVRHLTAAPGLSMPRALHEAKILVLEVPQSPPP